MTSKLTHDISGKVEAGDVITYTLVVSNKAEATTGAYKCRFGPFTKDTQTAFQSASVRDDVKGTTTTLSKMSSKVGWVEVPFIALNGTVTITYKALVLDTIRSNAEIKIVVGSNYFSIDFDSNDVQGVNKYTVKFEPEIPDNSRSLRKEVLKKCRDAIKEKLEFFIDYGLCVFSLKKVAELP